MGKRNVSPVRAAYQVALRNGLTSDQAANAVAVALGVRVRSGQRWTLSQIEHLLFLRVLEEHEHPEHIYRAEESDVPDP